MLTFTAEQMSVFFKGMQRRESIPALCRHLRSNHKQAVMHMDEDQLFQLTEQSVNAAMTNGLTGKNDTYSFVALDIEQFPGFYKHPVIADFFKNADADSTMKMIDLFTSVPFDVWNQVRDTDR